MGKRGLSESPHLKVCVFVIEGDVDGEGGGVVVRPQVRLPLRRVFNHKVHQGVTLPGTDRRA